MRFLCRHRIGVAAGAVLASLQPVAAEQASLQPYQLVRSLQRLQDQIASGDKPALGMQREMVNLIDKRLENASEEVMKEPRNARAVISYAMSGGNPATLENLLPRIGQKDDHENEFIQMGIAVLIYQKGSPTAAAERLAKLDPMAEGGMLGAGLALVRGMVSREEDASIADLKIAALLAPGTLVEEAALRRMLIIYRKQHKPREFLHVAARYARTFIESPYALQFAHEFKEAVVDMDPGIDRSEVLNVLDFMPQPYRDAMRTRVVRQATVAGKNDLVRALTEGARPADARTAEGSGEPAPEAAGGEPTDFYALISQITSENVAEVAKDLSKIDPATLSEADRELLRAVLAVAGAVTGPIPSPQAVIADTEVVDEAPASQAVAMDDHDQASLPMADETAEPTEEFKGFLSDARKTLDGVDKILEDVQ